MGLGVCGDGIVQVQHEHRGSVLSGVDVRTRTVRQPQDGEDLPLHLPALLAPQPPLDEAGAHLVVHGEVGEGDLRGQHAVTPRQECQCCRQGACHHSTQILRAALVSRKVTLEMRFVNEESSFMWGSKAHYLLSTPNTTPSSSVVTHCLTLPCALLDGNLGMDFIEAVSGEGQEGFRME